MEGTPLRASLEAALRHRSELVNMSQRRVYDDVRGHRDDVAGPIAVGLVPGRHTPAIVEVRMAVAAQHDQVLGAFVSEVVVGVVVHLEARRV